MCLNGLMVKVMCWVVVIEDLKVIIFFLLFRGLICLFVRLLE